MMQKLYQSLVAKRELSWKPKLSIYSLIYGPTLTNGQKLWVVIERTKLPKQVAEICFFYRVAGLSLRDRVENLVKSWKMWVGKGVSGLCS